MSIIIRSTKKEPLSSLKELEKRINEKVRNSRIEKEKPLQKRLFSGQFINPYVRGDIDIILEEDNPILVLHYETVSLKGTTLKDVISEDILSHEIPQEVYEESHIAQQEMFFNHDAVHILQGVRAFKRNIAKEYIRDLIKDKQLWFLLDASGKYNYYQQFGFRGTGVYNHICQEILYKPLFSQR